MSVNGLEHYSKDQLIEELINRETFAGIVVYHRGDAKSGQLEPGEVVVTKSPPLTREGVERLLHLGSSLVPPMFDAKSATENVGQAFPLYIDLPPLSIDEGGVVRVGASRVTLDLVVEQYENGMSPEDFVRAYDTLTVADVYAAIAYYLRHQNDVQSYLKWRNAQSDALRQQIEAERPRIARNELASRSGREEANAPTGQ